MALGVWALRYSRFFGFLQGYDDWWGQTWSKARPSSSLCLDGGDSESRVPQLRARSARPQVCRCQGRKQRRQGPRQLGPVRQGAKSLLRATFPSVASEASRVPTHWCDRRACAGPKDSSLCKDGSVCQAGKAAGGQVVLLCFIGNSTLQVTNKLYWAAWSGLEKAELNR